MEILAQTDLGAQYIPDRCLTEERVAQQAAITR